MEVVLLGLTKDRAVFSWANIERAPHRVKEKLGEESWMVNRPSYLCPLSSSLELLEKGVGSDNFCQKGQLFWGNADNFCHIIGTYRCAFCFLWCNYVLFKVKILALYFGTYIALR